MRCNRRHLIVGLAAVFVGAIVWRSWAGPVLPQPTSLPDELVSLSGLKQVDASVAYISPELVRQRFTVAQAETVFREQIRAGGLAVTEGAGTPRFVMKVMVSNNPDHPKVVSLTTVVGVHQEVHLKRLDRDMILPTTSMTKTVVTTRDKLNDVIVREVKSVTSRLVSLIRRASE